MPAETVALAKGVTRREFLNYVWGADHGRVHG